jgi:hypothetical protein
MRAALGGGSQDSKPSLCAHFVGGSRVIDPALTSIVLLSIAQRGREHRLEAYAMLHYARVITPGALRG